MLVFRTNSDMQCVWNITLFFLFLSFQSYVEVHRFNESKVKMLSQSEIDLEPDWIPFCGFLAQCAIIQISVYFPCTKRTRKCNSFASTLCKCSAKGSSVSSTINLFSSVCTLHYLNGNFPPICTSFAAYSCLLSLQMVWLLSTSAAFSL